MRLSGQDPRSLSRITVCLGAGDVSSPRETGMAQILYLQAQPVEWNMDFNGSHMYQDVRYGSPRRVLDCGMPYLLRRHGFLVYVYFFFINGK